MVFVKKKKDECKIVVFLINKQITICLYALSILNFLFICSVVL